MGEECVRLKMFLRNCKKSYSILLLLKYNEIQPTAVQIEHKYSQANDGQ